MRAMPCFLFVKANLFATYSLYDTGKVTPQGRRTTPTTPASQEYGLGFRQSQFLRRRTLVLVLRPCKEPCWIVLCHPKHGLNRHAGRLCSTLREMQG